MAELTKEQLNLASDAFKSQDGLFTGSVEEGLKLAAPFLQMPWDGPTLEEVMTGVINFEYEIIKPFDLPFKKTAAAIAIGFFVQKRNDALLPKPVDPREDAIIGAMQGNGNILLGQDLRPVAKKIIAALDKVKP